MTKYKYEITAHGKRQLELDVKYPLTGKDKIKRYRLDLFMFSPYQLEITRENYGVSRFLRDMKSYTRYSTYSIPLIKLADLSCSLSPIARISNMLKQAEMEGDINEKSVIYELRILASIYRRQLRDIRHILRDFIVASGPSADVFERLTEFLADVDLFLRTFRALRSAFIDPKISDILRQALRWSDESISLSTEKALYKLYDLFVEKGGLEDSVSILENRFGREQKYRVDMGYPTVVKPDNPAANEFFVYREGVLKKWTDGCMFMTTERSRLATHISHLLMSIAAGAAMAFAVIVAVFASRWFVMHSMPWAVLIIAAYIAKDRIKELLRGFFAAYVPRLIADKVDDLIDPAIGTKIGSSRARAIFSGPDKLPSAVNRIRNMEENVFRNILLAENVIHFQKDVRIDSTLLMRNHKRLESLTEIIRFKLDSWLENMDEPVNQLFFIKNDKRTSVDALRVYHVNLIVSLCEATRDVESCSFLRYRLVLNRDGIVRVDKVFG